MNPDGAWIVGRQCKDEVILDQVYDLLVALAERPAETAAAYGRLNGRCCFCNRGLADERSTAVGYGPVCAGRWGLPWE